MKGQVIRQVILKNIQWLGRHNPGFPPGSVQTAVAELLNPTSSILPYSAHLLIGRPTVAASGRNYFNIDAGATKNVNFVLAMPAAEGIYPVYLDIFSNDELIEDYRAAEDVVIGVIAPECTPGEWKCVRYDLYVCSAEGKWVFSKRDAPQCQYGW